MGGFRGRHRHGVGARVLAGFLLLPGLGGAVAAAVPLEEVLCRPGGGLGIPEALPDPRELAERAHCTCISDLALLLNTDRIYDDALMWTGGALGGGSGAFAEYFETPDGRAGAVCSILLDLSSRGAGALQTVDLLVWEDAGGRPGAVLGIVPSASVGAPPPWPFVRPRNLEVYERERIGIAGPFWAGFVGNWSPDSCSILLPVDTRDDRPESPAERRSAMTLVAPGIEGMEAGWQPVGALVEAPAAVGIGVVIGWCPVPVAETTWGRLKRLYAAPAVAEAP